MFARRTYMPLQRGHFCPTQTARLAQLVLLIAAFHSAFFLTRSGTSLLPPGRLPGYHSGYASRSFRDAARPSTAHGSYSSSYFFQESLLIFHPGIYFYLDIIRFSPRQCKRSGLTLTIPRLPTVSYYPKGCLFTPHFSDPSISRPPLGSPHQTKGFQRLVYLQTCRQPCWGQRYFFRL